VPYFTRYVLGASDKSLGSMFLAQMLGMMLSQFAWVKMARRYGRRNGLMAAAILQVAALFCWFLIPPGHPSPWLQILAAIQGISGGGVFFGLYTVLTDTMDHSRKDGDSGREGVLAGVFVMVEKATTALGTFILSSILALVGYVSAKDAGAAIQPPHVILGISIAMSVLPALCALAACLLLRKLNLPHNPAPRDRPKTGTTGTAAATVAAVALVAIAAIGHSARAAEPKAVDVPTRVMIPRVYTGPDGNSTIDEVELPRVSGGDGKSVSTRLYATDLEMGLSSPGTFIDWHGVTTPRILVVLTGALEIGLGDGTKHILKPGSAVLVTDMAGRGHTSRSIGAVPVTGLTIRLNKEDMLKPKLSPCPPNVVAANCVSENLTITRPGR
jgi:MFS family permease